MEWLLTLFALSCLALAAWLAHERRRNRETQAQYQLLFEENPLPFWVFHRGMDKLKIDRSFVNGVDADPHNAAICESILSLARSFGLAVTAEGVETPEQLQWLRAHGCDLAQGYLLARPQPFEQMLAALAAS